MLEVAAMEEPGRLRDGDVRLGRRRLLAIHRSLTASGAPHAGSSNPCSPCRGLRFPPTASSEARRSHSRLGTYQDDSTPPSSRSFASDAFSSAHPSRERCHQVGYSDRRRYFSSKNRVLLLTHPRCMLRESSSSRPRRSIEMRNHRTRSFLAALLSASLTGCGVNVASTAEPVNESETRAFGV
jgi:hypothetical protein